MKESTLINAPIDKIYKIIWDFESYPDFQSEVRMAKIVRRSKKSADVAFTINLVAEVHYSLHFTQMSPTCIEWETIKGDSMMKSNRGSWNLVMVKKGQTELICEMEVELGLFVPKSIVNGLIEQYLPNMLRKFKERAENS